MLVRCIAFDCFGTVFNMEGISREEISEYVKHVKSQDFSPYDFPPSWWDLTAHPDARKGIATLQGFGWKCVALSNGSMDLIHRISEKNGIHWDAVIDLVKHEVYKPHPDAYRTIKKDLGYHPWQTLMVTANPTFGDIEGAKSIGMETLVIRHGYPHTIEDILPYISGIGDFTPLPAHTDT